MDLCIFNYFKDKNEPHVCRTITASRYGPGVYDNEQTEDA
jgi:hypothetical protein